MEVGELIELPAMAQDEDLECPFDHDPGAEPPDIRNELGGIGTTLGANMTRGGDGKGIDTRKDGDFAKFDRMPNPVKPPGKSSVTVTVAGRPLRIDVNGEWRELPYPVACAAHHIIPAQESLKDHPILNFMCQFDKPQDFRKSGKPDPDTVEESKVWANCGYNVNGGQNGIWLPGNYAVGAGTGAVELWKPPKGRGRTSKSDEEANQAWVDRLDDDACDWEERVDSEEQEEGVEGDVAAAKAAILAALGKADISQFLLSGRNHHISDNNPKWCYVEAAMELVGGHFHDRHGDYSLFVRECLDNLTIAYIGRFEKSTRQGDECSKCKEAADKKKEKYRDKVGPPINIVQRLNSIANYIAPHLESYKSPNIFSSKWVREKMKKLVRQKKKKDEEARRREQQGER